VTPDRVRRGSALDLRLRLRQARAALGGMDTLYDDLGAPELCTRLKGLCLELAEVEQRLGDIAEANRTPLHTPLCRAAARPAARPDPES
jgi:hypothetical protein